MPESVSSALESLARGWASEWGEENPQEMQWVSTTRDQAMRLLYSTVASTDEPAFLLTCRGDFSRLRETGKSTHGVWAALFIDPVTMEVRSYTVRPWDFIPDVDLSVLGPITSV
ncbi:hypothetical protein [Streptomyces sp. NPDC005732]|uniref:hypothetical protein n=1 Tax=Streptomyces sp. NPDC005732 TaxID=3157057 RepID=UPI0033FB2F96